MPVPFRVLVEGVNCTGLMKGELPQRMGTSKDLAEFQALVSAVKKINVGKRD